MKLRELTAPYVVQEVDYVELRLAIERAFAEEYGSAVVQAVRVAHYNPDVIDATVVVQARQPAMDDMALYLSEMFRREGLRVAIRVTQASAQTMMGESSRSGRPQLVAGC
jgi:hypothetical protein